MSRELTTISSGHHFLEGPRWHDGRLWFSDFYAHSVYSCTESGDDRRVEAEVAAQPSGLGWLPDGRLVIVSMKNRTLLVREADGMLTTLADLSSHVSGHLNDLVVDADGRCYVGNFGFDLMGGGKFRSAEIHRVDPDGTITEVATGLNFPNALIITDDGRMLANETFGNRISEFDIDASGNLSARRDWAVFGDLPQGDDVGELIGQGRVAPDGGCLDAEGCMWIADAIGSRAVRVSAGGEIVDEITAGTGVFACMLGGADGKTLFMCTAPDFDEHARTAAAEGAMLAARVDVPGAGRP